MRTSRRRPENAITQMKGLLQQGIALAPVELAGGVLGLAPSSSHKAGKAGSEGVFGDALIDVNGLRRVKIVPFLRRLGIEVEVA